MAKDNLTEIVLVLDRSGSMAEVQSDMIGGMNKFVEEQKKLPGEATLTMVQFDTKYEILFEGRKMQEVGTLDLQPRGCTALLDAVGRAINTTVDRMSKMKEEERPGKVAFFIITDGHENSSHEFKKSQIQEMIKQHQEKDKWAFNFLGANQDAFDEAGQIGIGVSNTLNYANTSKGVSAAYSAVHDNVTRYRVGGQSAFTQADRDAQDKS